MVYVHLKEHPIAEGGGEYRRERGRSALARRRHQTQASPIRVCSCSPAVYSMTDPSKKRNFSYEQVEEEDFARQTKTDHSYPHTHTREQRLSIGLNSATLVGMMLTLTYVCACFSKENEKYKEESYRHGFGDVLQWTNKK